MRAGEMVSEEKKNELNDHRDIQANMQRKGLNLYKQTIYRDWCKACGICIAFCPRKVFDQDELGKPVVARADECIGCQFCEMHCPDFAITIEERHPERRRKSNGR